MKKMLSQIAAMLAATTTALAADYTISTLAELREFIASTQDNDYAGDTIRLAADIDCQGGRFN
ncbi:MAG: hypothetical protein IJR99_14965, partial [Kiritimatiellae bacterium]|nr:hypothetical protein [Kiritimatiellia bacterium]